MRYQSLSVSRQILLPAIALLIVVFAIMIAITSVLSERGALRQTEVELNNELKIIIGALDSEYESVKLRGERQGRFFEQFLGGTVQRSGELVRTGDADLPELTANGTVLNGNVELLERFQRLTGEEAAVLVVHQGKVYRAATLLKTDGRYVNGLPLPDTDPVAQAVLRGEGYQGLVIRNGEFT